MRQYNRHLRFAFVGDVAVVWLTKGQSCILDSHTAHDASVWCWQFHGGYACRKHTINGRKVWMYLHRFVWEAVYGKIPDGMQIDHINQDKLDNRLSNLRVVTPAENSRNRPSLAGTRGVSYIGRLRKWRARIKRNKVEYNLGFFATEQEASSAYNEAAQRFGSVFAQSTVA